jgi:hypothetical protein
VSFNLLRLTKNMKNLLVAVATMSSMCISIQEEYVVVWLGLYRKLDVVLNSAEVAFIFLVHVIRSC